MDGNEKKVETFVPKKFYDEEECRAVCLIQRVYRGYKDRKFSKKYFKTNRIRNQRAREILSSEMSYSANVHVLVACWVDPIQAMHMKLPPEAKAKQAKKKKDGTAQPLTDDYSFTFTEEDFNKLFQNIKRIAAISVGMINKLQERFQKWDHRQRIGDLFIEFSESLVEYQAYYNGFSEARDFMTYKSSRSSGFRKFNLDKRVEQKGKDLASFLIEPVQRIPRYQLLLKDLIKDTWTDHPDYENMQVAFKKISEVAGTMNEGLRRFENQKRIVELQGSIIESGQGVSVNLLEKERRFVYESKVTVDGEKDSHLFLFNDLLLWCTTDDDHNSFHPKMKYDPFLCSLTAAPKSMGHAFIVKHPAGSFICQVQFKPDIEKWLNNHKQIGLELQESVLNSLQRAIDGEKDVSIYDFTRLIHTNQEDMLIKILTMMGDLLEVNDEYINQFNRDSVARMYEFLQPIWGFDIQEKSTKCLVHIMKLERNASILIEKEEGTDQLSQVADRSWKSLTRYLGTSPKCLMQVLTIFSTVSTLDDGYRSQVVSLNLAILLRILKIATQLATREFIPTAGERKEAMAEASHGVTVNVQGQQVSAKEEKSLEEVIVGLIEYATTDEIIGSSQLAAGVIGNCCTNKLIRMNVRANKGHIELINLFAKTDVLALRKKSADALKHLAKDLSTRTQLQEQTELMPLVVKNLKEAISDGEEELLISTSELVKNLCVNDKEGKMLAAGALPPILQLILLEKVSLMIHGVEMLYWLSLQEEALKDIGQPHVLLNLKRIMEMEFGDNFDVHIFLCMVIGQLTDKSEEVRKEVLRNGILTIVMDKYMEKVISSDGIFAKACGILGNLSREEEPRKKMKGMIRILTKVIEPYKNSAYKQPIYKESARTLGNLAKDKELLQEIIEEGGVTFLVEILRHGQPEIRIDAARALANISVDPAQVSIIREEALNELVKHLGIIDGEVELPKYIVKTLCNLCAYSKESKAELVVMQTIPLFIKLLESTSRELQEETMKTVSNILMHEDIKKDFNPSSEFLRIVMSLMDTGTAVTKIQVVKTAISLCEEGQKENVASFVKYHAVDRFFNFYEELVKVGSGDSKFAMKAISFLSTLPKVALGIALKLKFIKLIIDNLSIDSSRTLAESLLYTLGNSMKSLKDSMGTEKTRQKRTLLLNSTTKPKKSEGMHIVDEAMGMVAGALGTEKRAEVEIHYQQQYIEMWKKISDLSVEPVGEFLSADKERCKVYASMIMSEISKERTVVDRCRELDIVKIVYKNMLDDPNVVETSLRILSNVSNFVLTDIFEFGIKEFLPMLLSKTGATQLDAVRIIQNIFFQGGENGKKVLEEQGGLKGLHEMARNMSERSSALRSAIPQLNFTEAPARRRRETIDPSRKKKELEAKDDGRALEEQYHMMFALLIGFINMPKDSVEEARRKTILSDLGFLDTLVDLLDLQDIQECVQHSLRLLMQLISNSDIRRQKLLSNEKFYKTMLSLIHLRTTLNNKESALDLFFEVASSKQNANLLAGYGIAKDCALILSGEHQSLWERANLILMLMCSGTRGRNNIITSNVFQQIVDLLSPNVALNVRESAAMMLSNFTWRTAEKPDVIDSISDQIALHIAANFKEPDSCSINLLTSFGSILYNICRENASSQKKVLKTKLIYESLSLLSGQGDFEEFLDEIPSREVHTTRRFRKMGSEELDAFVKAQEGAGCIPLILEHIKFLSVIASHRDAGTQILKAKAIGIAFGIVSVARSKKNIELDNYLFKLLRELLQVKNYAVNEDARVIMLCNKDEVFKKKKSGMMIPPPPPPLLEGSIPVDGPPMEDPPELDIDTLNIDTLVDIPDVEMEDLLDDNDTPLPPAPLEEPVEEEEFADDEPSTCMRAIVEYSMYTPAKKKIWEEYESEAKETFLTPEEIENVAISVLSYLSFVEEITAVSICTIEELNTRLQYHLKNHDQPVLQRVCFAIENISKDEDGCAVVLNHKEGITRGLLGRMAPSFSEEIKCASVTAVKNMIQYTDEAIIEFLNNNGVEVLLNTIRDGTKENYLKKNRFLTGKVNVASSTLLLVGMQGSPKVILDANGLEAIVEVFLAAPIDWPEFMCSLLMVITLLASDGKAIKDPLFERIIGHLIVALDIGANSRDDVKHLASRALRSLSSSAKLCDVMIKEGGIKVMNQMLHLLSQSKGQLAVSMTKEILMGLGSITETEYSHSFVSKSTKNNSPVIYVAPFSSNSRAMIRQFVAQIFVNLSTVEVFGKQSEAVLLQVPHISQMLIDLMGENESHETNEFAVLATLNVLQINDSYKKAFKKAGMCITLQRFFSQSTTVLRSNSMKVMSILIAGDKSLIHAVANSSMKSLMATLKNFQSDLVYAAVKLISTMASDNERTHQMIILSPFFENLVDTLINFNSEIGKYGTIALRNCLKRELDNKVKNAPDELVLITSKRPSLSRNAILFLGNANGLNPEMKKWVRKAKELDFVPSMTKVIDAIVSKKDEALQCAAINVVKIFILESTAVLGYMRHMNCVKAICGTLVTDSRDVVVAAAEALLVFAKEEELKTLITLFYKKLKVKPPTEVGETDPRWELAKLCGIDTVKLRRELSTAALLADEHSGNTSDSMSLDGDQAPPPPPLPPPPPPPPLPSGAIPGIDIRMSLGFSTIPMSISSDLGIGSLLAEIQAAGNTPEDSVGEGSSDAGSELEEKDIEQSKRMDSILDFASVMSRAPPKESSKLKERSKVGYKLDDDNFEEELEAVDDSSAKKIVLPKMESLAYKETEGDKLQESVPDKRTSEIKRERTESDGSRRYLESKIYKLVVRGGEYSWKMRHFELTPAAISYFEISKSSGKKKKLKGTIPLAEVEKISIGDIHKDEKSPTQFCIDIICKTQMIPLCFDDEHVMKRWGKYLKKFTRKLTTEA